MKSTGAVCLIIAGLVAFAARAQTSATAAAPKPAETPAAKPAAAKKPVAKKSAAKKQPAAIPKAHSKPTPEQIRKFKELEKKTQ